MRLIILSYLLICLSQLNTATAAPKNTIKEFSASAEFTEIKISPEGEYLSGVVIDKESDKRTLIIVELETLKPTYIVNFKGKGEVGNYHWVNADRIVVQKTYKRVRFETSSYRGEMLAVNADGSRSEYIFGYKEGFRASGYVLDTLPEDKKKILVMVYPWTGTNYAATSVYEVNVYNGKRKKLTVAPISNANFLADHDKNIRFSFASDNKNNHQVYYFDKELDKWVSAESFIEGLEEFYPLSFSEDGKSIYASAIENKQTRAIYKIKLPSGEREKIIQHPVVDPSEIYIDDQTKLLYAVEFENGYPEYEFIDKDSSKAKFLNQLMTAIPDHRVRIVSETLDGGKMVVKAMNDKNPGDYYLFDTENKKIKYLFSEKSWLDPSHMSEVKPIEFTNRYGAKIHGYLTLPKDIAHKNMPFVVNPHGGPHGPRDYWAFNSENQLLAQNGIAVLQVNFTGSGGYGKQFEENGYRAWGTKIQYDIIDGTKFIIEQGLADKERICISGGSFGGYSSLMAPTIEPDMYKCAIGTAGVYDLEELFDSGDIPESYSGGAFLDTVLGSDKAQLKAMSPSHNVDKLKAKILLLHGEEDVRASMEQFEAMTDALDKANYPYEQHVWDKAGHGFYVPESREEYFNLSLKFLKENLKL
ncbi:alpha/beta hydrolase family protein [Shewanella goraebulensis]|uniref:alpha/beta hydrolase family protein n=1 Tax=Shewanella goraebulensis TaxID=3050637 RepID=UPI00254DAD4C|nr:prolyl oligopeptidase family serine peptidase [Shewanella goraebulensis]